MSTKEPIDPYKHQKRYATAQGVDGLVRVTIWAPRRDRERLLKYGEKLRNKFYAEIPEPNT